MKKIKLFCIPPAGMSAVSYSVWKTYASENIEIIPLELAGRGMRFKEEQYKNFEEAINDVYNIIINKVNDNDDYAIFGHCMGSWIIYELCNKLTLSKHRLPIHAFLSGKQAPHIVDEKHIHKLPDNEFMNELIELGGITEDFLEDEDMLNMFLPVLKNDFRIFEEYNFKKIGKMLCDVSVLYGKEDKIRNRINEWDRYMGLKYNFYEFDGGHFFIYKDSEITVNLVSRIITSYLT